MQRASKWSLQIPTCAVTSAFDLFYCYIVPVEWTVVRCWASSNIPKAHQRNASCQELSITSFGFWRRHLGSWIQADSTRPQPFGFPQKCLVQEEEKTTSPRGLVIGSSAREIRQAAAGPGANAKVIWCESRSRFRHLHNRETRSSASQTSGMLNAKS